MHLIRTLLFAPANRHDMLTQDGLEVLYARSRVILAARLGGLQALDRVFTGIRDDEAFRRMRISDSNSASMARCVSPRDRLKSQMKCSHLRQKKSIEAGDSFRRTKPRKREAGAS